MGCQIDKVESKFFFSKMAPKGNITETVIMYFIDRESLLAVKNRQHLFIISIEFLQRIAIIKGIFL